MLARSSGSFIFLVIKYLLERGGRCLTSCYNLTHQYISSDKAVTVVGQSLVITRYSHTVKYCDDTSDDLNVNC